MTTIPSPKSPPRCDGASVGVLIENAAGALLIGDRTDDAGAAPAAGHVFDEHTGYEAAARAEVFEELGLTVTTLSPVTGGWRPNRCTLGPAPDGRRGHEWRIYSAEATGTLTPDPDSFRNVRYADRAELAELAGRTVAYVAGRLDAAAWTARPGLEPVWVRWLTLSFHLYPRPLDELVMIEQFMRHGGR